MASSSLSFSSFPFGTYKNQTIAEIMHLGKKISSFFLPGTILCLEGPLGVGKTTFARSIIHSLCPHITSIPSPSFPLIIEYSGHPFSIMHMDLFRLEHASVSDLRALGIEEFFAEYICLVEWPKHMDTLQTTGQRLICRMDFGSTEEKRTLSLSKGPS